MVRLRNRRWTRRVHILEVSGRCLDSIFFFLVRSRDSQRVKGCQRQRQRVFVAFKRATVEQ